MLAGLGVAGSAHASENAPAGASFIGALLLLAGLAGVALLAKRGVFRSRDWAAPSTPDPTPGQRLLLIAGAMFLTLMVAAGLLFALAGDSPEGVLRAAAGPAAMMLALLVGVAGLRLGPERPVPGSFAGDARHGLLGFLVLFPAAGGAGWLARELMALAGSASEEAGHVLLGRLRDGFDPALVIDLSLAVLLAPIVEELMYRRCLQRGLVSVSGRAWFSVLVASGLFTAMHLESVSASALASIAVVGLGCGIAMERTGRVWVPVIMHLLFNLANLLIALASLPADGGT